MKKGTVTKANAVKTQDGSMLCGLLDSTGGGGSGIGTVLTNVLATRHGATEIGACSLPQGDYTVNKPVALGDIASLGYLKFRPDLCGHILRVDCGNGPLNIIVTNSNLGGGLDLYASSWSIATNNKPPGETKCSVN